MNGKSLARIAFAIVLVCAVAASLWFASPLPVKALEIEITNSQGTAAPTSGTIGSTYSFRVKVSIEDTELLPIKNIDLKIYNAANSAAYYDQYTNLALGSTGYVSYTTSGTGAAASIKATPDSMWGYFTTGVTSVTWKGTGYTFAPIVGGYGYASGTGTTAITYDINWTPPSAGWPTGGYKIEAKITAQDDKPFTQTSSSFTLSTASGGGSVGGGGGGGGGGVISYDAVEVEPGVWDVSSTVSSEGTFEQDVTLDSEDDKVELAINKDTVGKTKEGAVLSWISITELADPPALPQGANVIGLAYELGPDGATFNPEITLTFTYDPDEIPEGDNEEDLVIAMWANNVWNEETNEWGAWVELPSKVDSEANTITVLISHFSVYTIVDYIPSQPEPAAFTVSSLNISPAEVAIGESVTISVLVTNTGDLSGDYEVALKVNSMVVDTKTLTSLAGDSSQTVIFTVTGDIVGSYDIEVNGLTGSFIVSSVEVVSFTTSALTISPAEVNRGQTVIISVLVTNTGELSGSYRVTLKINNLAVDTEDVTLAGGANQRVTFTTAQEVSGTYNVTIDALSGTFTVTAPAVPPPQKQVNWWLIVGIIVAGIIIGITIVVVVKLRKW
ncbi:CARDB domain-containing protein [Chloroflexota bacterium]